MISLPFIKVDANVDMEVFVMLEVFARLNVAMVAAAAAGAAAAALILFCLLRYSHPLETHCASPSSTKCYHHHEVSRDYQSSITEHDKHPIGVDIVFASTSHDELFQLRLQFLD